MTETKPHILVVLGYGEDQLRTIECPYTAEERAGKCAYLAECGCSVQFRADARLVHTLTVVAAGFGYPVDPTREELELDDWFAGCFIALDVAPDAGMSAKFDSHLRIDIKEHEECPKTGLRHQMFEGELNTQTGECSHQGELAAQGSDLFEGVEPYPSEPGRYEIVIEWDSPEESYVASLTPLEGP